MLTLERKIGLGFGAALIVLIASAIAAWWTVDRFSGTHQWVNHTREILGQLDQARSHILEMQSGVRGFVLTGQPELLRPYEQGSPQLDRAVGELRRLTADNPLQQQRLAELQPRLVRAREVMRDRIETRQRTGSSATAAANYGEGQRSVDAVRELLAQMADDERQLLEGRLERARRFGRYTVFTILGISVVAIGLVAVALRQVRRELRARQQAESALQASAARISDLYHHAPCGYHSLDGRGVFLEINDTALGWLGYRRDELVNRKTFADILTPDSAALFASRFETFKQTGIAQNVEYEWRRKDGSTLSILLNATAAFDSAGNYTSSRATTFDVTERKRAERERDRFFTLSGDLLCIAEFDGRFKRVNPAWEAVLGFKTEQLVGQAFVDFVHPDDRQRTIEEAARLSEGAESVDFENRYRCADGSYRWLRWNARAAPDEKLVYASARDVTERKQAEDRIHDLNSALAARATDLEAANRELEAFSYSVSHDLRAPLRHIDGFGALLVNKLGDHADGDIRRYVTTIQRAANQMSKLIEDLLSFSRLGRATLRQEPVNQNRLLADVIREGHYDTTHPVVTWSIAPLPEVKGDAALLRQVWVNLIDNAVKYSRQNPQPRVTIEVSPAETHPGEYVFSVRDNGVGFDMAYASRLFGVFQRLHAASEFEGTGIGLANVRRIVARHGGRTWAEGRVGEGAVFYFSLPVTLAHAHARDSALRAL